ncbi:MAG: minor capsid protein [Mycobacterium sp.]
MRGPGDEPRSVNERILDSAMAHAMHFERLKNGEARRIRRFIDEKLSPALFRTLQSRLDRVRIRGFDRGPHTTKRIREVIAATNTLFDKVMPEGYRQTREAMVDVAKAEAAWQVKSIKDAMPVVIDMATPSPQLLRSVVVSRPYQGRIMRDWWKTLDVSTRTAVRDAVQIGIAGGETNEQIIRRLRGTARSRFTDGAMEISRRNAEAIVRTTANHVSTHARQATFEENQDVVDRVQWVATLDTRTTLVCASRDGKTFPVTSGPRPPAHYNCRSTVTPVTKSFRDLGIDLDEIPDGTRASIDGQVPAARKYEEWLKGQSKSRQLDVLGPQRLALWEKGVPFRRMLNAKGDELTVKQILEREGMDPKEVFKPRKKKGKTRRPAPTHVVDRDEGLVSVGTIYGV